MFIAPFDKKEGPPSPIHILVEENVGFRQLVGLVIEVHDPAAGVKVVSNGISVSISCTKGGTVVLQGCGVTMMFCWSVARLVIN
jgi:hypothetical protein